LWLGQVLLFIWSVFDNLRWVHFIELVSVNISVPKVWFTQDIIATAFYSLGWEVIEPKVDSIVYGLVQDNDSRSVRFLNKHLQMGALTVYETESSSIPTEDAGLGSGG
jgi:hypothetical protein